MKLFRLCSLIVILLACQISPAFSAPALSATWSASGSVITVSVSLGGNEPLEPLAGLQLNLNYQPSILDFQSVTKRGAASMQSLYFSANQPAGTVKVLLTPTNGASGVAFSNGEILRFSFTNKVVGNVNTVVSISNVVIGGGAAVEIVPGAIGQAAIVVYDNDGDGIPDADDPDDDNDGIPDWYELQNGMNPFNAADAGYDSDGDGLTNLQEYTLGTNPYNPDTDGDGVSDGDEVAAGTDPVTFDALAPSIILIIDTLLLGN